MEGQEGLLRSILTRRRRAAVRGPAGKDRRAVVAVVVAVAAAARWRVKLSSRSTHSDNVAAPESGRTGRPEALRKEGPAFVEVAVGTRYDHA